MFSLFCCFFLVLSRLLGLMTVGVDGLGCVFVSLCAPNATMAFGIVCLASVVKTAETKFTEP